MNVEIGNEAALVLFLGIHKLGFSLQYTPERRRRRMGLS
jgi:hypothetical protein